MDRYAILGPTDQPQRELRMLAQYFLAFALGTVCKIGARKRHWTGRFSNTVIRSTHKRKPDVILLSTNHLADEGISLKWEHVRSLVELTSTNGSKKKILDTICNKVFICFTVQPNRRFMPALYICNGTFRFCVYDRSGGVQSIDYDLRVHHIIFIRLMVGLGFAEDPIIGYDPSMTMDYSNVVYKMRLNDKEYKAIKLIIASQSLRGRATHVWTVADPTGKVCIMKDCWIAAKRNRNEVELLKELKGLNGVPQIIHGELVRLSGEIDSTAWLREGDPMNDLRYHLRIAMTPVGVALCKFESQKELVGVFMDIIQSKSLFVSSGMNTDLSP